MPTLADVAKIAGVGVMSVSRVVNQTRKVSPEVERRVRMALERIGYEPNEAARILKGHRARVVGVIVPDLADPFFATCVNVIQEALRDAGYMSWMAASGHSEDIERRDTQVMTQRKVSGILVIPSGFQNEHFVAAKKSGIPIVSFDRPLEHFDADRVVVDNRRGAARATQHLIDHSHRHILCIVNYDQVYTRTERIAGYSETMQKAGLDVRVCYITDVGTGTVKDQLTFVLNSYPKPTAIFAADNTIALEALQELQKRAIQIPRDIAFIAFDDFDASTLVRPAITVIRQPVADVGQEAASLLLSRIGGAIDAKPIEKVLATKLVIRESCGCQNFAPLKDPDNPPQTANTGRRRAKSPHTPSRKS